MNDKIVIITPVGELNIVELSSGQISIGKNIDCDVVMSELTTQVNFTKNSSFVIASLVEKNKNSSGPWAKKLSQSSLLELEGHTFLYLKETALMNPSQQDWSYSSFPDHPQKSKYPDLLLKFLLGIIQSDQGAILYLCDSKLQLLAKEKIQLKNQSELFIHRILESNPKEAVINMSYNTHTLLFEAGLSPLDFCLIQSEINESEKVVLYLPHTQKMRSIPSGTLKILLKLCAGQLTTHLLHKKNQELRKQVNRVEHKFFWGNSNKMKSLKKLVDKLSSTNLSVLIQGETGTGKEMLVNYMSEKSQVKKVVTVNCAAIPKDLSESILFGHKKGSFTGAVNDQKGKLEEANGGILFLDEVGELDLTIQAKLLRAIQESKITPVGGKEVSVNFWLITATHKDLELMITEGEFREDLFFRINEANLRIPSLSERREDIEPLSQFLADDIIVSNNLDEKLFSKEYLSYIKTNQWNGNIRELMSFIRKSLLLSDEKVIGLDTVQFFSKINKRKHGKTYPDDLQISKKIFVAEHIEKVLADCDGNKTQAAKKMGITPRNLYRLLSTQTEEIDRG